MYGNGGSGRGLPTCGLIKTILMVSILLVSSAVIIPVSASVSDDTAPIPESRDLPAQDNPEAISALKTHIAYVGQSQDARMNGVISYIDRISDAKGSQTLREIRDDYLCIASSIPLMQTADDISEARLQMQQQSRLFAEETKAQIVIFDGNTTQMREHSTAAVQVMEESFVSLNRSLWLAKESARLTVFNRESEQRATILQNLSEQGVDVSRAAGISDQIDAKRSELKKALTDRSVPALLTVNAGIKPLNREFRKAVDDYKNGLTIEMKRAAIIATG